MTPLAIALIVLVAMFLLGLPIFMSLIISSVVAILAGRGHPAPVGHPQLAF